MRPRTVVGSLLFVLTVAACGEPTNPRVLVLATPVSDGLVLRNESGFHVAYSAMDEGFSWTASLTFCGPVADPAECHALAPRRSVLVPYARITGYHSGGRVVVFYGALVRNPVSGLYEQHRFQSISVVAR